MNMIEKVSKAILETPNASDYNTLVARNAIQAMLEPTEEMMTSGYADKEIYQSMIQAALKD